MSYKPIALNNISCSLLYHYEPVSIVSFLVRYFLLLIIYLKRVRIVSAKNLR